MSAELSIVIPVYNGSRTIGRVVGELAERLRGDLLEIVLVNDGSPDNSGEVCRALVTQYRPAVKYVELSRNFTEHNAVMAGLRFTAGAYVAILDDDNQNPASEVLKLLAEIRRGYDAVYSCYDKRRHHWARNLGSRFNDLVANVMIRKPRDLYLSSFKIMNRFLVDQLKACANPYPYIDGLIFQVTSNIGRVLVEHQAREEGRSNYTVAKLVGLWLNMFTNFSILPLRLAGWVGFAMALIGFGLGVQAVVEKFLNPQVPLGYSATIVAVLVIGGIQCFLLGMLGEYLGRLFLSVNRKPQFIVRRTAGFDE